MTQAELARRAGVSREWLVRLERGHPRLEMQLVLDTLAAVGLTLTATEDGTAGTAQETRWSRVLTALSDSALTVRHDPPHEGQDDHG
jgi:transcriptional regulator with XRE-family HTH domain